MRDSEYILFENGSASHFCEAYPIGNGHLGGMVYGNLPEMRLSLNRDDLWSGAEQDAFSDFDPSDYRAARDAALIGDYHRASEILSNRLGRYDSSAYLPLGDLLVCFPEGEIAHYRRSLNLRDSVATVSFSLDGARVDVRYFASFPDGVVVMEVASERPISLTVSHTVRHNAISEEREGVLLWLGECPLLRR